MAGVQALDISTGTLYVQNSIPAGTSYTVKARNYFQPLDNTSVSEVVTGEFIIDFGEGETTVTLTVPEPSISSGNIIVFVPKDNEIYFSLERISITTLSITQGVGFEAIAYAPNGACGSYTIKYILS